MAARDRLCWHRDARQRKRGLLRSRDVDDGAWLGARSCSKLTLLRKERALSTCTRMQHKLKAHSQWKSHLR